ncbi:unnamed protein product, partial [Linum tenue]
LQNADLAELAPVGAVGGERDVSEVVADDLGGEQGGALRENDVVRLHHFFCGFCGGDDQVGDLAQLQAHHAAVPICEVPEAVVGQGAAGEVVEVPDYGQLCGSRR